MFPPAFVAVSSSESRFFVLFKLAFWSIFAYCFVSHLAMVFAPWPLEYREGAVLFQISGQLHHLPVYTVARLPVYLNVYGSVYNTLGTWVCQVFGTRFQPLRSLSFVAILCSLGFFLDLLRRRQVAVPVRMILALTLYIALLFATTPLARPDALGFLLYVFCFWLFEVYSPTLWVVLTILLIADLDLLTKQYFVLIAPLAVSYIFFFKSRVRGAAYALLFAASVVLVYKIDMHFLPGYFPMTIAVNSGATPRLGLHTIVYMLKQSAAYLVTCSAVFLVCAAYQRMKTTGKPFNYSKISFPAYASVVVILVLSLKLGQHNGAWMTYYFQLLSPLLFVAMAPTPSSESANHPWRRTLLVASLAFLAIFSWKAVLSPWQNLRLGRENALLTTDMQPYASILASPQAVASLVQQDKPVYVSGQSNFFYGVAQPSALRLPGVGLTAAGALGIETRYEQDVSDRIASGSFDLVITDPADNFPTAWTSMLNARYHKLATRIVDRRVETEWVPGYASPAASSVATPLSGGH